MAADVCVQTRLRCPSPERCQAEKCALNGRYYPMSETRLTRAEQYALAMSERQSEQLG